MVGRTIAHYKILEKLGEGGMGVVYKAHDLKLDRDVALKFLPHHLTIDSTEKERFINEARAAAALTHQNIAVVYEIGEYEGLAYAGVQAGKQTFIAMEYVEGQTLKYLVGPRQVEDSAHGGNLTLPVNKILDIAIQVCNGLAAAHDKGIVHRDIKPDNIMVTPKGQVKITDFGLAKLRGATKLTRSGSTLGTVAYMSPEQARGDEVDHRTDIWALGVVLYEIVTCKLPFKSEYDQAVIYSILNEDPEPVTSIRSDIPSELDLIIERALTKNSEERYQNAAKMRDDLENLLKVVTSSLLDTQKSTACDIPSIAVLPFRDMSSLQDQEYFCEGIAEELINALVQVEGLRVAARTSASQFKDKAADVRAIGRQLNVRNVLEGSVRKAGDRLRITAQLIDVNDGYHLFSEKYDRTTDDIFAIQDEISLAIVDKLKIKLLGSEKFKLVKRHTENEEAYRLYLQGRYFWNRRHMGGLQRGIECFQKASTLDPEYAHPYAGIADCYYDFGWWDFLPPKEAFGKCKEAAQKALKMDPDLAEAHASLAVALEFFDWDWQGAEAEFQRSIDLNPSYATARHFYSMFLTTMGRFDEAIAEQKRAVELDPVQPIIRSTRGWSLWVSGRNDDAIEQSLALTEFDPNFFAGYLMLGISYAEAGKFAEAEYALKKTDELAGGTSTLILGIKGYVFALAGKLKEARAVLNRLLELRKSKYVSAMFVAHLYSFLGEQDAAFKCLESAIEERDHWCLHAKHLPTLRLMRSDPRFIGMLQKAGLEQ